MVLAHGTTADRTRWLTVVDQLAARYTVHAMDRRGRGLSVEESAGPHSIQREAADVVAVVEAAGTGVYLVGHSFDRVREAAAAGDREQVLQMFFREVIELPEAAIHELRTTPVWQARLKAAHTLLREGEAVEAYEIPDGLSAISIPVRVFLGTESPHYFRPRPRALWGQSPAPTSCRWSGRPTTPWTRTLSSS